jgi:GT2 family glycosyltransferase
MDVSIIIVNTNTKALLKQALKSVFEKTKDITFEVIVVDNTSRDGSQEMLREEFPNVILIETENKGFGWANNVGAKYAKGKYLFLLNPDTIVLNNAVKILADFLDSNPKVGICGGNLFDENKKPVRSYGMFFLSILWELNHFLPLSRLLYGRNWQFNHTCLPRKVDYIIGTDLMIRSDLFNQLNGFDPDFFVYYEEVELTFRVKKAGYEVYSVPQANIIHLEGQTFSGNWKFRTNLQLESRGTYYRKTHGRFIIVICNILYWTNALLRCIVFKITAHKQKYIYWRYILNKFKDKVNILKS